MRWWWWWKKRKFNTNSTWSTLFLATSPPAAYIFDSLSFHTSFFLYLCHSLWLLFLCTVRSVCLFFGFFFIKFEWQLDSCVSVYREYIFERMKVIIFEWTPNSWQTTTRYILQMSCMNLMAYISCCFQLNSIFFHLFFFFTSSSYLFRIRHYANTYGLSVFMLRLEK